MFTQDLGNDRIMDLTGKNVLKVEANEISSLDLSSLTRVVYFLQLQMGMNNEIYAQIGPPPKSFLARPTTNGRLRFSNS